MNTSHIKWSGIADEAGKSLATQIRAHQELGWKYIEVRNVDGEQLTNLSDDKFEKIVAQLQEADIQVSCFASGIANWATKITDDFHLSVDTLERAMKRMQRLDTKYIRVMSYPNDGLSEDDWRDECVRRFKELGARAEAANRVLVVENCDGWASTSPENYARFFQLVNMPSVQAVYDTGNPASHGDINTWNWYQAARPHLAYLHIKAHTTGENAQHTWPDSGESCIAETLRDLSSAGYGGFISIEPHLKAVVHEGKTISDEDAAYQTYVEYGQRLMKLAEQL
ncbi:MAG TPA: sugar phosphate isomerase/epimerase family protein [Abditibacteriaceae bacterium]|jgi:sugar phosphate isomerase/epimerase|nr:sugar phosphate isomerase/epimerase family protein [Abditibacteriaceae bacterium]